MSACEEDEGRPNHQVSRFQPMAPIRAAATIISPIVPWGGSMIPLPTVVGDLLAEEGAEEVHDGRHEQGDPGVSARVETEVAIAFAASWKPLV